MKTGTDKSTKRRKAGRKRERFQRHYHSEERVRFVKRLPCICGGRVCKGGPTVNSHDPTKGAGGTYLDIHPATDHCHRLIDANDFWHRIGITREEANARTHHLWLDYSEGLTH